MQETEFKYSSYVSSPVIDLMMEDFRKRTGAVLHRIFCEELFCVKYPEIVLDEDEFDVLFDLGNGNIDAMAMRYFLSLTHEQSV